jgi:hypothetical protein
MLMSSEDSRIWFVPLARTTVAIAFALFLGIIPPSSAQPPPAPANSGTVTKSPKPDIAGHDMSSMHSMDMKKSMESMSKEMTSMQMTGDADLDFARMMRAHHQGAIDMSRAELATGKDREMRQLAKEIISAQEKEIALIDRWLKKYETSKGSSTKK